MITLITGPDAWRARKRLREVVAAAKKNDPSGINTTVMDASADGAVGKALALARTAPFLAKQRVTVLRYPELLPAAQQETLLKGLDAIPKGEEVQLVLYAPRIDRRRVLFTTLKKRKLVEEYKPLSEGEMRAWISAAAKKHGITIAPDAQGVLVERCKDLFMAETALKMLFAFAGSSNKTNITRDDVLLLVRDESELPAYKLLDAIAARNVQHALQLLHEQLDGGAAPIYVLAMLRSHVRVLLMVQDAVARNIPLGNITMVFGTKPFVVNKARQQARQYTPATLRALYKRLLDADATLKDSPPDVRLILDTLVLSLVSAK